jgi:hypothetical protein
MPSSTSHGGQARARASLTIVPRRGSRPARSACPSWRLILASARPEVTRLAFRASGGAGSPRSSCSSAISSWPGLREVPWLRRQVATRGSRRAGRPDRSGPRRDRKDADVAARSRARQSARSDAVALEQDDSAGRDQPGIRQAVTAGSGDYAGRSDRNIGHVIAGYRGIVLTPVTPPVVPRPGTLEASRPHPRRPLECAGREPRLSMIRQARTRAEDPTRRSRRRHR